MATKQERRTAFIAGMKNAFEIASEKMGVNFGCSAKEKNIKFEKWYKTTK